MFSSSNEYSKVERVLIKEQEITEVAEMNGKDVPACFLLNVDDNGYGFFTIDDTSMKYFEEHLGKVSN